MKSILPLSVAFLGLGILASADTFRILSDRASQNPTDIIDWSQLGPDSTVLSTPQLVSSFNGNLALVGDLDGGDFVRADSGTSWFGNFDYGETLVWTGNPSFGIGGGGPFAMLFQDPVESIGFSIEADFAGPFVATVTLLDTSLNLLTSVDFPGVSAVGTFDGSAPFVGLFDNNGAHIGGVLISTDSGFPLANNDFAIDDPSFTTPEPNSAVLFGSVAVFLLAFTLRSPFKKTSLVQPRP